MTTNTNGGGFRARAREVLPAAVRGLVLALVILPVSVLCFTLTAISLALIPIGVGVVTTPWVLGGVRDVADVRRRLAYEWCGVRIRSAYRAVPEGANPWTRMLVMIQDRQVWRDLLWLPVDMTAGFVTALLPAVLLFYAVEGFALAAGLWRVLADGETYWYEFVPVSDQPTALAAAALGAVLLVAAFRYTPALLTAHFRLTAAVLDPGKGELVERVRVLTETRK
ncbi:sensor domain-containing protein, partial [Streptomyces sp. NPDC005921]